MSHSPTPNHPRPSTPGAASEPVIVEEGPAAEQAAAIRSNSETQVTLARRLGLQKWPGSLGVGGFSGSDFLKHTPLNAWSWLIAVIIVSVGTLLRISLLVLLAAVNEDNVWGLLNKWDAAHYVSIAREGYFSGVIGEAPAEEIRLAFFPAFPMIMRAIHVLTGMDYALAGILFNFVATVFLAAGVMALVSRWGHGLAAQSAGAIVATTAPMAIVFNMPYTEALFGALAVWGLVALVDRRWGMAAGIIFALTFVRITAVALLAVYAIMVVIYARKNIKAWVGLVLAPLPLVGFIAWASQHLESVGGYFGTQEKNWNTGFDFGAATLKWILMTLTSSENAGYLLTTLVIVGVPIALVVAWRRVDVATWLFSLALSANIILSDGVMHSRPRLMLPAAVLFIPWVMGALSLLPRWVAWLLIGCWALFGSWFSAYMLAVFPWAI